MQAVSCPVCGQFVGHAPDGWVIHVLHDEVRPKCGVADHALTVERPPVAAHYTNPD